MFCFVVLVLLAGFLAGCGGGQSEGNNSGSDQASGAKEQGSKGGKGRPSEPKIVLGTVKRVNAENRMIVVRPSTDEQGNEPLRLKIPEDATIELDNEQAELADIKEGQQAQVTYFVRKWGNQAREVSLFSADGATSGSENTS
jgi:hypothetical protein